MSRRSTVTTRERPVTDVTTVAGPLRLHGETLTVRTTAPIEVVDLTDPVMALVRRLHVGEGFVHLFSLHTTCTVVINECQPALLADYQTLLEGLVASGAPWRHNDPAHSDCDRRNAEAHLRAMLLGHALTLQVSGGEIVLGRWQRILLAELDGPQPRTVRVQVMGVAQPEA